MGVADAVVRYVVQPAWDLLEGSVRLSTWRRLNRRQWESAERIRQRRDDRLRRLVRHAAATCPFYAKRFREAGIDMDRFGGLDDLERLPLLTKDEIRRNADSLLSSAFPRESLVLAKTGGSTGEPLWIHADRRCVQQRAGAALLADEWSGWRLGQPIAAVWGNPPVATTLRSRLRRLLKDRIIYLDTMRINDEAISRFIEDWHRCRPGLLFGHAHSIFLLAEILLQRGVRLPCRGIVATSMMLIRSERECIEAAFGIPVTNRYGCEEVSLIACECERHEGLHLNQEHVVVEFLRDDGRPCAAGEEGRIVVTELINFGQPLIRYEVGDRGGPAAGSCSCGRGLPLMESISGRMADFLHAEDGSRVAGISLIENSLTRFPGLRQLQIIQDEPLRVVVNIVAGDEYSAETGERLSAVMRESLGTAFQVELNLVDTIAREPSGKYRFSICRI